jgi:DNA-binding CsgD family transcriptional regulator
VHSVVPAHIGVASRHVALGELDEAVRVARAGLAIVDRTGYRTWAGHRLLPVLAEAHLIQGDLEGARSVGERLRREAVEMADPLAGAWADACDALALWLGGAGPEAADALRGAAEQLEAIPFIPDALRVRRRLAACLAGLGDRDGAVRELRRIHEGFVRLGAERELEKTRRALHELGARPPVRSAGLGAAGLTARELQITGLVGARKSNKAIARELGISARTVDTHLSNIFRKLEVGSRGELVEVARTLPPPGS